METLEQRLGLIDRHVGRAVQAAQGEATASPVLRAVLGEFERKSRKVREMLQQKGEPAAREYVVEFEEAADCAKVAAEADAGLSAEARKLVVLAHDAICMLKAGAPAIPE